MSKIYIFRTVKITPMKKINWNYTLGEILIVIIGISIAFSLNKCAENSQDKKLEKLYLENLKNDIETDKSNLEQNLELLKSKEKTLFNAFKYFNPNFPKRDSLLTDSFMRVVKIVEFSPKSTTHQTLINSGDLKLISNFNLKTTIQEHYRTYDILQQDYDRMVNISKKYIADYFIYNLDMDKYRKGERAFNDERLLKSIIQSMYGAIRLKSASTEKSIQSCKTILERLHNEVN